MNTYTAELIAKIDLEKPPILYNMAPKEVMKRLLNIGYKTILLRGELFEQFDGGIFCL